MFLASKRQRTQAEESAGDGYVCILGKRTTENKMERCMPTRLRGFAKKKFQKIRDYYGSGWEGPGLTRIFFGKSSQNSPKPVLIFWSSIPCVFCLYIHC